MPGAPAQPAPLMQTGGGQCLKATEVAAIACLAMEACVGFSPDGTIHVLDRCEPASARVYMHEGARVYMHASGPP